MKQRKAVLSSLDVSMFWLIPFLAGLRIASLFLSIMTILSILKLVLLIKNRSAFSCYELCNEIINKTIWLMLNFCFILLLIVDWNPELINLTNFGDVIKMVSFLVIVFILGGVGFEALFSILDLLLFIKQRISKCMKNKIKPE